MLRGHLTTPEAGDHKLGTLIAQLTYPGAVRTRPVDAWTNSVCHAPQEPAGEG